MPSFLYVAALLSSGSTKKEAILLSKQNSMSTTVCMDYVLEAEILLAQGSRKGITLKTATVLLAKNKEDTQW